MEKQTRGTNSEPALALCSLWSKRGERVLVLSEYHQQPYQKGSGTPSLICSKCVHLNSVYNGKLEKIYFRVCLVEFAFMLPPLKNLTITFTNFLNALNYNT